MVFANKQRFRVRQVELGPLIESLRCSHSQLHHASFHLPHASFPIPICPFEVESLTIIATKLWAVKLCVRNKIVVNLLTLKWNWWKRKRKIRGRSSSIWLYS